MAVSKCYVLDAQAICRPYGAHFISGCFSTIIAPLRGSVARCDISYQVVEG